MFNLQPFCDKEVIISAEEYESPPNDHVTITNVKIEGDCLILKYVASGCDESAGCRNSSRILSGTENIKTFIGKQGDV